MKFRFLSAGEIVIFLAQLHIKIFLSEFSQSLIGIDQNTVGDGLNITGNHCNQIVEEKNFKHLKKFLKKRKP